MITLLGKVMAEVLSILALSTKEMQQKRISEYILYGDAFWLILLRNREIHETVDGKNRRRRCAAKIG
jgi:hypothetical protein